MSLGFFVVTAPRSVPRVCSSATTPPPPWPFLVPRSWPSDVLHLLPYSVASSRSVTTTTYRRVDFTLQRRDIIVVLCVLPFSQRRCPHPMQPNARCRARSSPFSHPTPILIVLLLCFHVPQRSVVCDSSPRQKNTKRDPGGRRHHLEARPSSPGDARWPSPFKFVVIPVSRGWRSSYGDEFG